MCTNLLAIMLTGGQGDSESELLASQPEISGMKIAAFYVVIKNSALENADWSIFDRFGQKVHP